MKRCNCGTVMIAVDILDYPKIYCCPHCGGTLNINKNGTQQWFDATGNPATYDPQNKCPKNG